MQNMEKTENYEPFGSLSSADWLAKNRRNTRFFCADEDLQTPGDPDVLGCKNAKMQNAKIQN